MGGTPALAGTPVPVQTLLDDLKTGGIDDFLDGFPTVTTEQVIASLEAAEPQIACRREPDRLRSIGSMPTQPVNPLSIMTARNQS
jgi:uncharacterized protein (DUF433 family)